MQTDNLKDLAFRIKMNCSYVNLPIIQQKAEIESSVNILLNIKSNAELALIQFKLLGCPEEQEAYIECIDALLKDAEYKIALLKKARKVQLYESRFKLISACLNAVAVGIILSTIFAKGFLL